jgi:hypothetical protein
MVLMALVIIPLLIISAFAVDLGWFYVRAARLQRAADAAALAGVVHMPGDFARARAVALEAAARNGVSPSPTVDVDVAPVPGKPRQLRVTVTDHDVPTYLGAVVMRSITIRRTATAEYVLPVPLGSPENRIGTGNILGSPAENFWLAVSGYCSSKENGDLLLPVTDGNYFPTGTPGQFVFRCTGSGVEPNADYDPDGYTYAVDTGPTPLPLALHLEVYDPAYGSSIDGQLGAADGLRTTFVVTDTRATPLDPSDDVTYPPVTFGTESANRGGWVTLRSFAAPLPNNRYLIRVYTNAGEEATRGSNSFALRARVGPTFTQCTTIPGQPGYLPTCPQVHGVENMSIFANLRGTQASFYLADVGPEHAGKTMVVSLFDPGEGASRLEVLDPNGNPVRFDWSTPCDPPTPPTGGCSGSGTSLDVSGTGTQPGPNRASTSRYNDRKLTLRIPLPADFGVYGGKTWWRIRYTVGSSPTDRTTWSVIIEGDPVHLVNDD